MKAMKKEKAADKKPAMKGSKGCKMGMKEPMGKKGK